ncbi:hypothetical protein Mapa_015883 [Marchantia paleacea]|nr:hypothetical protein Mapa_015883 [Marchantia paleacea]
MSFLLAKDFTLLRNCFNCSFIHHDRHGTYKMCRKGSSKSDIASSSSRQHVEINESRHAMCRREICMHVMRKF